MPYAWVDHQIFGAEDGAILYGIDQGSLFLIDRQTRETISRWRGTASLEPEFLSGTDREILEELRNLRILVPEGVNHRRPQFTADPKGMPLSTMVLEVAQDCNLACRYCYADGGAYGKPVRLLDPDTARQAVRRLVADAGDGEQLTLVLFGGEPLLNMAAVRAAVDEAETMMHGTGKRVFISLTTNGTLLTPEIAAFIRKHRIAVSVSMDGPADLHDANRVTAGGAGSYDAIVARLPLLLDAGSTTVAARVTLVPQQWPRVEEVFDHLLGLGFHEVGIAPASPVTLDLLPDPAHEEALLDGFTTLARRFVREASQGRVLRFSNLIDLLARLHVGQAKTVACGAGYGYLAVDAGGSFYLCHRLTGDEEFRVGTLDSGPDGTKIRAALDRVTAGNDRLCADCWARTLCSGGCHYENHLREEHLGLAGGGSCTFIRRWLQLGIETYAELRACGADAVLKLLERRAKC